VAPRGGGEVSIINNQLSIINFGGLVMASVAQIQANRLNAQKSTGPRTPEGKATASQNAVRHGLLAEQVVIKGEDPAEFEGYRDRMLGELAPVGAIETMLAERAAGLAWRLRRAERLQSAVFATVYRENADDIVLWPRHGLPIKPGPNEDEVILGQVVMTDFARAQILDRLLVHERRIESSLYRTMAELRRERQARMAAAAEETSRSERCPPAGQEAAAPAELGSFGAEAVAEGEAEGISSGESRVSSDGSDFTPPTSHLELGKITPDGVTTNVPAAGNHGLEAHAAEQGQDALATGHGRDARAAELAGGVAHHSNIRPFHHSCAVPDAPAAEPLCETNPIAEGRIRARR
jgi:hypothetical protein